MFGIVFHYLKSIYYTTSLRKGDIDDDFRLFVHSSVQAVARTVTMLKKQGRFAPPDGQSAYITHLGIKYRGWASEKINAEIPDVLRASSDGLEVVLG